MFKDDENNEDEKNNELKSDKENNDDIVVPNINIPEYNIKIPKMNIYIPKMDIHVPRVYMPKIERPSMNIEIPKMDIDLPKINIDIPKMNIPKMVFTNINIPAINVEEILKDINFKSINDLFLKESTIFQNKGKIDAFSRNLDYIQKNMNDTYFKDNYKLNLDLAKKINNDFADIKTVFNNMSFDSKDMASFLQSLNLSEEEWTQEVLTNTDVAIDVENVDLEETSQVPYYALFYIGVVLLLYIYHLNISEMVELKPEELYEYIIKELGETLGGLFIQFSSERIKKNKDNED